MRRINSLNITLLGVLAIMLCFAQVACEAEEEPGVVPGELWIEWEFPVQNCQITEVSTVETRLYALDEEPTVLVDSKTSPCEHEGPIVFDGLLPGRYRVEAEGFNDKDKGTHSGVYPGEIYVAGGEVTILEDPIVLTQKKSAVDIQWSFADGKLCSAHNVAQIQISIFDEGGAPEQAENLGQPFLCDPHSTGVESDYIIGENPVTDYQVKGILVGDLDQSKYYIEVEAQDLDGNFVNCDRTCVTTTFGEVTEASLLLSDTCERDPQEAFADCE